MWETITFKTRKALDWWIKYRSHNYRWEEVFANNAYGVTCCKLTEIYKEEPPMTITRFIIEVEGEVENADAVALLSEMEDVASRRGFSIFYQIIEEDEA